MHARGAGAHGVFVANGAAEGICQAAFLQADVETPVFVRFSTVARVRAVRPTSPVTPVGFATRFYTDEGNYDLVGNNIPVFFIQDGIKFPDVVHAVKPHPDREIPQAQSAHDTFWDFVSLHTEAQAHTMWNMSDRGIPRSYRTMEGFGVHTWRLINDDGETCLVKFHWKPRQGVHSVTWEEAQLTNGYDPDFHRRDLADAIESGAYPAWDLGVQVMPDTEDQTFEGIDLLDPTKFVPEELAPVQLLGTMTLNAQPDELLRRDRAGRVQPVQPGRRASTSPTTRCCRRGCSPTSTPRSPGSADRTGTSCRSTGRTRRSTTCCATDSTRTPSTAVPRRTGRTPSTAVARSSPGHGDHPFIDVPEPVAAATKERRHPASFDDHFSQVTLFFRSLAPVEQDHVTAAYTFELSKCYDADHPGTAAAGAGQHRRRPVQEGRRRSRSARTEADRRHSRRRAQRGLDPDRRDRGRSPVARSASSSATTSRQPPSTTSAAAPCRRPWSSRSWSARTAARSARSPSTAPTPTRPRSSSTRSCSSVTSRRHRTRWSAATPRPATERRPASTDPRVRKLVDEAWRHAKAHRRGRRQHRLVRSRYQRHRRRRGDGGRRRPGGDSARPVGHSPIMGAVPDQRRRVSRPLDRACLVCRTVPVVSTCPDRCWRLVPLSGRTPEVQSMAENGPLERPRCSGLGVLGRVQERHLVLGEPRGHPGPGLFDLVDGADTHDRGEGRAAAGQPGEDDLPQQ